MFVLCFRIHLHKLFVFFIIFVGFLAFLNGVFHVKPPEVDKNMDNNGLESEPHAEQDQLDRQTAAHENLLKDNTVIIDKLLGGENADSVHVDKSVHFGEHSTGGDNAAHSVSPCDEECVRFRNILLTWPRDKPKAAIYYLAKADRLNLLNSSLTSLYHSFLYSFDYPVIVFHEADARASIRHMFRNQVNIRLFFQEVQFDIPGHINASAVKFHIRCLSHIGYRHMCRFHAKQVYDQAILEGLEYIWRLDDDSLLPAHVDYDLLAFMWRRHLQYGYIKIHVDSYDCTVGLWNAVKHYAKQMHLQLQYFEKWDEPKIYYNNFEISALSLWMSKQYQDYINFVDLLGGIYYYRWGDAPIKSIAVTLFLSQDVVHLFTDITYQHGNFFVNVSYSSF